MNKTNLISISGRKGSGKDLVAKIIQFLTSSKGFEQKSDYLEFLKEDPLSALGCHKDDDMNWAGCYDNLGEWKVQKFAGKLKDIVCILLGCTREQLEDQEYKNTPLPKKWNRYYVRTAGEELTEFPTYELAKKHASLLYRDRAAAHITIVRLTPRKLLQVLGTEGGRQLIHPDIWVNATFATWVGISFEEFEHKFIEDNGNYRQWKILEAYAEWCNDNLQYWLITDARFPNEISAVKDEGGIALNVIRYRTSVDWYEDISEMCTILIATGWENNYKFSWSEEKITQDEFIERLLASKCSWDEHFEDWLTGFNHDSETALLGYKGWYRVIRNEGSIEDLIEIVKKILIELKLYEDN